MTTPAPTEVVIRRQWNSWKSASVLEDSLHSLRWDRTSGGVHAPAPQYFLHAYVSCNELLSGSLDHTCRHGQGPHRIKVCTVKKNNPRDVFERLAAQAGLKPQRVSTR